MMFFFAWSTFALLVLLTLYIFSSFLREGSPRPAIIGGGIFTILSTAWLALLLFNPDQISLSLLAFWSLAAVILFILFIPTGRPRSEYAPASERADERDIMFARARYREGDGKYERYYEEKPEIKNIDDTLRALPNLGEPGGSTWDRLNPAIADALFFTIDRFRDTVDGPVNETKTELSPEEASARLKGLARFLGAADAGTAAVGPEHVYTRVGRGTGEWGESIDPADHPWAIVFTVEMKHEMMSAAPLQPELADSGRQYLEAAKIALGIAHYLRALGHPARAHIDGNYRLIMPTLARDAGLGEIGRHSLLITPREGTRVRIGAVSTSLPLAQDEPIAFGVEDFCTVCKKCAVNCPPNAIPNGGKAEARGTRYWKINPVRCYRMWRHFGTDCGLCVATCPYSRPRGGLHAFVRAACRRSALSRRIFARMDDLFYGRSPRSRAYPDWMKQSLTSKEMEELDIR